MDEKRYDSNNETKKATNTLSFIVTLASVMVMVVALILPYVRAVGNMADYIGRYPDRVEIETLEITARELANVPIISVSNIVIGLYGEEEGVIAKVIVAVLSSCLALTVLFVIFKKPVAVMIFDLMASGVLSFLNYMMKESYIVTENTYTWGFGYYTFIIASFVVFAGAVWMLVTKIGLKRQAKKALKPNLAE